MTAIRTNLVVNTAVAELEKIVGPRRYWIHNQIGGRGWKLKETSQGWVIEIDDPVIATFIQLKLGS